MKIEMINKIPPQYMKVAKSPNFIPDYKQNVMGGMSHPLEIETQGYILQPVGKLYLQLEHLHSSLYTSELNKPTPNEINAVDDYMYRPEINWVLENSFDGMYVQREVNHLDSVVMFLFSAYMTEEHCTFWTLKYA